MLVEVGGILLGHVWSNVKSLLKPCSLKHLCVNILVCARPISVEAFPKIQEIQKKTKIQKIQKSKKKHTYVLDVWIFWISWIFWIFGFFGILDALFFV